MASYKRFDERATVSVDEKSGHIMGNGGGVATAAPEASQSMLFEQSFFFGVKSKETSVRATN